ncbi:MAG: inositol monophosphatase family protein [Capsulimonas sp.]|uniref:inositol monophosphatase family protein n=1 Tax=Capsulimonas sp. TaxID=2494211 RepID=UPI00326477A8
MTPQETVVALTRHIREAVRPHLGAWQGRTISGTAASGDATFAIDDIAEEAIVSFIEREKLSVAYYSEDKGLIEFGKSPEGVLIIDPIDGTRPAVAGLETCVVSVALADYTADVTMGDVRFGCIQEIKGDQIFLAERGKGARWIGSDGASLDLRLLPITEIASAPLTYEIVARPIEWIAVALGDIINAASTKGGCFVFNSTAYSLTRLLTGQLAAVLDVGARILQDHPETRDRYVELGRGTPLGLFTYDIAAAALIATEAGAIVTDASGYSFDSTRLLDTSESNLKSIVAASNAVLHEKLMQAVDFGVAKISVSGKGL